MITEGQTAAAAMLSSCSHSDSPFLHTLPSLSTGPQVIPAQNRALESLFNTGDVTGWTTGRGSLRDTKCLY